MTDPCIISGQLVDAKNIGVHKCLRLFVDVPVEQAQDVLHKLGWPTMANPIPVAVARLVEAKEVSGPTRQDAIDTAPPSRPEHEPPRQPGGAVKHLPLSQIAGALCANQAFWKYLYEQKLTPYMPKTEYEVVAFIYQYCGIKSRSQIVAGTEIGNRFNLLRSGFNAWMELARVGPESAA